MKYKQVAVCMNRDESQLNGIAFLNQSSGVKTTTGMTVKRGGRMKREGSSVSEVTEIDYTQTRARVPYTRYKHI